MRIIEQSWEILSMTPEPEKMIERCARTCYRSESKDDVTLVKRLITSGHHAMLEFATLTVRFITNRGVSHELVRHRLASFAQESTRWCDYKEITFILPVWVTDIKPGTYSSAVTINQDLKPATRFWLYSCLDAESSYALLRTYGWKPEEARDVLTNSLATTIVVAANIREWRHIFTLRCSPRAHPQMRALMTPLLAELARRHPLLFGDIYEEVNNRNTLSSQGEV